jgi:hypothetical protein
MRPGVMSFSPSTGTTSFSYTFARSAKKLTCGRTLRVQWRSPTGTDITMRRSDLIASYQPVAGPARVCT